MDDLKKLHELASENEVTVDQVRYWITLLGAKTTRKGKHSLVNLETVSQVHDMASMVKNGVSPKEAAEKHKKISTEIIVSPPSEDAHLEGIKKALMLLVETNKAMAEELKAGRQESAAIRAEVAAIRQENNALRARLLPPEPVKVIQPWQPEMLKNPLEGMTWLQRAYVQIVEPWRMRQYSSRCASWPSLGFSKLGKATR